MPSGSAQSKGEQQLLALLIQLQLLQPLCLNLVLLPVYAGGALLQRHIPADCQLPSTCVRACTRRFAEFWVAYRCKGVVQLPFFVHCVQHGCAVSGSWWRLTAETTSHSPQTMDSEPFVHRSMQLEGEPAPIPAKWQKAVDDSELQQQAV